MNYPAKPTNVVYADFSPGRLLPSQVNDARVTLELLNSKVWYQASGMYRGYCCRDVDLRMLGMELDEFNIRAARIFKAIGIAPQQVHITAGSDQQVQVAIGSELFLRKTPEMHTACVEAKKHLINK